MVVWEKQLMNGSDKIIGLLYKISHDIFISKYRKQQVELKFQKTLKSEYDDFSPEEELQYNELEMKYQTALSKLPEKQRVVFLMSRNDELKYSEIANRLGLSVKAVEKRMSKAIATLKKEVLKVEY